jgi:hypothetical protein
MNSGVEVSDEVWAMSVDGTRLARIRIAGMSAHRGTARHAIRRAPGPILGNAFFMLVRIARATGLPRGATTSEHFLFHQVLTGKLLKRRRVGAKAAACSITAARNGSKVCGISRALPPERLGDFTAACGGKPIQKYFKLVQFCSPRRPPTLVCSGRSIT